MTDPMTTPERTAWKAHLWSLLRAPERAHYITAMGLADDLIRGRHYRSAGLTAQALRATLGDLPDDGYVLTLPGGEVRVYADGADMRSDFDADAELQALLGAERLHPDDAVAVETADALFAGELLVAYYCADRYLPARWSEVLQTFESAGLGPVSVEARDGAVAVFVTAISTPFFVEEAAPYGRFCPGWLAVRCPGDGTYLSLEALKTHLRRRAKEVAETAKRKAHESLQKAEYRAAVESTIRRAEQSKVAARHAVVAAREAESKAKWAAQMEARTEQEVIMDESRARMREMMGRPSEIYWSEEPK